MGGDDGVEESGTLDGRRQLAVIDKNRARRHARPQRKDRDFPLDLGFDFRPNFTLPFDFHDVGRSCGLDQEVDLASSFSAAGPVARVAIWRRRLDDGVPKVEVRLKGHGVVDNQVLELKSHHGVPPRERLNGLVAVCP